MRNSKTSVGVSLLVTLFAQGVRPSPDSCSQTTITRDVVVIGGGASGAHAAVWLRDAGKSVVLVEKADQLVSLHLLGSLAAPFLVPLQRSRRLSVLPEMLILVFPIGWPHQLLR